MRIRAMLQWIDDFYDSRIMNQSDPLALYPKGHKTSASAQKPAQALSISDSRLHTHILYSRLPIIREACGKVLAGLCDRLLAAHCRIVVVAIALISQEYYNLILEVRYGT